jgi:hypothetical protein
MMRVAIAFAATLMLVSACVTHATPATDASAEPWVRCSVVAVHNALDLDAACGPDPRDGGR